MLQLKVHCSGGQYLACRCGSVGTTCAAATAAGEQGPPPVSSRRSNFYEQASGCDAAAFTGGMLREHVTILRSLRPPRLDPPETAQRSFSPDLSRIVVKSSVQPRLE